MIKKLEKILIATSIGSLTLLPLIITNKDQIYLSLKNITKNIDENIYPIAKVEPMYEVKTLRKVTSDADAINVIFFGDNYAKDANENEFADFCYTNIVKPWLSTVYPSNNSNITFLTSGTKVPFQTFLNDKINVYSVQPNFKENNSIINSNDTFFGVYTPSASTSTLRVSAAGKIKLNVLTYDVTKNFLEENAIVTPSYSGLIRNEGSGRANTVNNYNATTQDHTDVHIHEMGHSIWGLSDEYNENNKVMSRGVNRFESAIKPTEENIPWKEFLNFRGIGMVNTSATAVIPSHRCTMNTQAHVPGSDFCEVCIHQIVKRGVEITQNEFFYVADPQLTPSEGRPNYNDLNYNAQFLETLELYDFKVDYANDKHLDFRTVVDNMTTKPKNIKLRVNISGPNGFEEFLEFHIEPGEIKQLKLISKNSATNLNNSVNTIIGEVIDADTNEVLATNYDRYNQFYSVQQLNPSTNFGKKLYTVTINFLDKATGQPLPNIKPSTLIKRNNDTFQLEKILFNGYHLDEDISNINNSNITINGQNLTFNYYYDSLPFKSLKLKLLDENNQQVQEKIVKVYQGQEFIPKSSDFFLYDLENFVNNNKENEKWVNSVVAPKTTYLYDQIEDNQTELVYTISQEEPTYMVAKDIQLVQGEDLFSFFHNNLYKKYLANIYNNDFTFFESDPNIIYNSVDVSTPGEYLVVFYFKNNMDIQNSNFSLLKLNIIVKSNQSTNFIPDETGAEKSRLDNYSYIWINQLEEKKGIMSDFEAINQDNLLNNINNFNLNYDRFDYEVLEFNKLYPGINNEVFLGYKFKIKISDKKTRQFVTTNTFTKYIWLRDDESTTPPTEEVEMQNEINRINGLYLSLKNDVLTQEEVNNINQNNILQNINGWVETTGFVYEIINFSNSNNQFKFSIKVKKGSLTKNSKEFVLSYQIKSEQTEQELLQQEINRINNLTLSLANNTFSQQEINQINASNFANNLSNWNSVTLNSNKYNYEIAEFNNNNYKFTFKIKVSLINDLSISQSSNQFSLDYKISANINQELVNEKNRIDQLNLTLNQSQFSQEEINIILNNPNSIIDYLDNWNGNNDQFDYQFIVNPLSDNQLGLTIKIIDKNNNDEYRDSKLFILNYEQSAMPINNVKSKDLTTIILASTLAPAGAIAAGVGGTVIYKKKRRRY